MQIKKSFILLAILMFTLATAQDQKVVVVKELIQADSGNHKIIVHHDMDILDSAKHKIINLHNVVEGLDSNLSNIFIHKMPHHAQKSARIIIKKSGLFRKNKIIIDFNPMTRNILKVTDNGKEVPEKKFHKYQEYLEDATDYAELEALHPRMEELTVTMELPDLPDSQKLADLEAIIIDLESLESDRAALKKEHFISLKRVIELEGLTETILGIMEKAGETPPQKIKEIEVRDGLFFLNGTEVKGELGQKCIEAYNSHATIELDGTTPRGKWFEKENSVKIILE